MKDIDAKDVVAWKNGLFHFERADGGDIQRNLNSSQVLEILQRNQVHFSIKDKKIKVKPVKEPGSPGFN
jgi:hypothetical protein